MDHHLRHISPLPYGLELAEAAAEGAGAVGGGDGCGGAALHQAQLGSGKPE